MDFVETALYQHRNQLKALHSIVLLAGLDYPIDAIAKERALSHIHKNNNKPINVFYDELIADLFKLSDSGSHSAEILKFFNGYGTQLDQLRTESRTFEEKTRKRQQVSTESRTLEEKTKKRIQVSTESRTLEEKTKKRVQVATEALQDHSKFKASKFYEDQNMINALFPNIVTPDFDVKRIVDPLYTSEGSADPAAMTLADNLIDKVVPLALTYTTNTKDFIPTANVVNYVNAVPVDSNCYLVPKHFFYDVNTGKMINNDVGMYRLVFKIKGINHSVDFDFTRLILLSTSTGATNIDAVLYDVTRTAIPAGRSFASQFIRETDLSVVCDGDIASMVGYKFTQGGILPIQRQFTVRPLKRSITYEHAPNLTFTVMNGLTYSASTAPGDCGSPLILHKSSINSKIMGIHLFGAPKENSGGALIITQEMLARSIPVPTKLKELDVKFKVTPRSEEFRMQTQGLTLEVLGELENPIHLNRNTKYTPTPLRQYFEDNCSIPSEKMTSEGLDPALVGTALFGSQINNINDEFKEECLGYLAGTYAAAPASVFTVEEALNTQDGMDRMCLDTSPGYPYVTRGESKLTYLSCSDKGEVTINCPLYASYLKDYCKTWEDTIIETPWVVSLKDSLDKPNKLARVFEIPPMEHTISSRAYFGSWISMMHKNVGKQFCCVGMNPESSQWSSMYYDLASVSSHGIDADAPNWDKNLSPTLMYWAVESINRWYQKHDRNWCAKHDHARNNIVAAMINSYLLTGSYISKKCKGMPSGAVLTALLNSIVNMIMHLIWFLVSVPIEYRSAALYDKFVRTYIYGDDSIDAIHIDMLPYLNRNSMIAAYSRYCSMTITSSQKDGTIIPYEPIINLTFLKRGFRLDGLHCKPTLSTRSLVSMISYVRKTKHVSLEAQLLTNMRVVLSFAYFYGRDYYNNICRFFTSVYPKYVPFSYSYFDNMYLYGRYETTQLY
jgi:hypothetical protein